jgi:type I site-specific restriction endonuclease
MSTGVNIKKIHEIILWSNSKSKIKVLQSLGRGLRKHPEKSKIIIFDIVDDMRYKSKRGKVHSNFLYEHWLERSKYYIEQEFNQKSQIFKLE